MDTRLVASRECIGSTDMAAPLRQAPPAWINGSPLLADAYSLAVVAHGEDPGIEAAGGWAVTVYAADKLSDILGLRRGVETAGEGIEERIGTSVASMTAHYGESVEMIESLRPGSAFLPGLRLEMERLEADSSKGRIVDSDHTKTSARTRRPTCRRPSNISEARTPNRKSNRT